MVNLEKKIENILEAADTKPFVVMLKALFRRLDVQQLDIVMRFDKALIRQKAKGISDQIFYAQSMEFCTDKAMKEKVACEMGKILNSKGSITFPLNDNTSQYVIDWIISQKNPSRDVSGLFTTEQWSSLKKDCRFRDYLSKSS